MNILKTFSIRSVFLLGSLGALALGANAQSLVAKANIPFEFAAGGTMMPPGDYSLDVPNFSGVVLLHGSAGNSVALLTTVSGATAPATSAKLIFERRDGMAHLTAVEWPGQSALVIPVFQRVTKGAATAALH
ncbi:MAG: hypothetical protein ACLPWF_06240 [Bryobacteraceae bacterium]